MKDDCFLNINNYFDYGVFSQEGMRLTVGDPSPLPPSLLKTELSHEKYICIPISLVEAYSEFRPTPMFRATSFEKAIGTNCPILIKDEGATPSGNHKINSALYIAHMCAEDGIRTVTTETTGNWGVALAKAAGSLGISIICFIDYASYRERPDRKAMMERAGASVVVVANDHLHGDLLSLSADAAIAHTKTIPDSAYVFGSVYGYFLVPQSLVGLEAKRQLQEMSLYPDIVVGSCGGGANLMGIASPFIVDQLETNAGVEIFSAESTSCPIITRGKPGLYGIDTNGYYPLLRTYGIEGIAMDGSYIGGLGSTIVASAVAHFHSLGLIQAHAFTAEEAKRAGDLFCASEGRRVAIETSYILAGVAYKARLHSAKTILASISSVGPEGFT